MPGRETLSRSSAIRRIRLATRKKSHGEACRGHDDHESRTHSHRINQSRPADKPETAQGTGKHRECEYQRPQGTACHKEVPGRSCASHGPETEADANSKVQYQGQQDNRVAPGFHHDRLPSMSLRNVSSSSGVKIQRLKPRI